MIRHSALLALHDAPAGLSESDRARAARRRVSDETIHECEAVVANPDIDLDKLSSFWITTIYQVAWACLQLRGGQMYLLRRE